MPTIVYPPTIDFEWLYQRPQQLLKAIAALGYKVVFYNYDYYHKQKKGVINEIYPNFFLCSMDVPFSDIEIEKPVISWISYPPNVKQIGRYNEKLIVFDAIDEASEEFVSWAKDLNNVIGKADVIFTTAKKLYNYHSERHKNVNLCSNGTDFEHFNRAQRRFMSKPPDMPKNDRPIIGYYGAIAPWMDWELIQYISSVNEHFNFVMVGPLYGGFKNTVKAKNIYYLGRKDYKELPKYLQWFDICMIPFKVTSMIESCNPIKMYEYLSAGKPVVSTNMPETAMVEGIYIGKSKEEFGQKIHQALIEKNDPIKVKARIEFAKNNSWDQRALTAVNVIEEAIIKKLGRV